MPATYEPIATATLSSAGTITFTSIPGTYTDLRVIAVGNPNGAAITLRFNSNSSNVYSRTRIVGDGSTATSGRSTGDTWIDAGPSSGATSTPYMVTFDIFSYAGSTNKTVLGTQSFDYNGSGYVARTVSLWRNTSAITSILVAGDGSGNLDSGFTATLYGILKA